MRWSLAPRPKGGTERVKRKYAWWPKVLTNPACVVWFEHYYQLQVYWGMWCDKDNKTWLNHPKPEVEFQEQLEEALDE